MVNEGMPPKKENMRTLIVNGVRQLSMRTRRRVSLVRCLGIRVCEPYETLRESKIASGKRDGAAKYVEMNDDSIRHRTQLQYTMQGRRYNKKKAGE